MKKIPFKVVENSQLFDRQIEGLNVIESSDVVKVNICQRFPTPGYSMMVSRIVKDKGTYNIHIFITPPRLDAVLLQVITYKSISIEIDKENLNTPPYRFQLVTEGVNRFVIRDDRKEY